MWASSASHRFFSFCRVTPNAQPGFTLRLGKLVVTGSLARDARGFDVVLGDRFLITCDF